jgi:hypothetical protein
MSLAISLSPFRLGAPIQNTPPGIQTIPSGAGPSDPGVLGFAELATVAEDELDKSCCLDLVLKEFWGVSEVDFGESHPNNPRRNRNRNMVDRRE